MLIFASQNLATAGPPPDTSGSGYAPGDCWAAGTWFVGTWTFGSWGKSFVAGVARTRIVRHLKYFFGF